MDLKTLVLGLILIMAVSTFQVSRKETFSLLRDHSESLSLFANLVKKFFRDAASVVILHDESPLAIWFLQNLMPGSSEFLPLQIGSLLDHLKSNDSHLGYSYDVNHQQSITVIVFEDVFAAEDILIPYSVSRLKGSLLFINLNTSIEASFLLVLANNAKDASLMEANINRRRQLVYMMISYLPFRNEKFFKQKLDVSQPLERDQIFQERFADLGGHELRLASWVDDFPMLFYTDANDNTTASGLAIHLLKEMSRKLNFTYHIQHQPPDGMWGDLINGTWVGMAGQLVREEKDLVVNSFAVLHDRSLAMDFTVTIFSDSYSAVLRLPPPLPRWLGVVYPFTGWVWVAILTTIVLLTASFFSLQRFTSFDGRKKTTQRDIVWHFLWLGRCLLRQSVPGEPGASSKRIAMGLWLLGALVLSSSYFGNLIAYITIPGEPSRIKTLEELAMSDHSLYMLDYGAPLPSYLSSSTDPVLSRLEEKLQLLLSYEEIQEQVINGKGVIIEGTNYIEYEISGWPVNDMYYVREVLHPTFYAWAFQKGIPWVSRFNRYLTMMLESGLITKWHRDLVSSFRQSRTSTSGGPAEVQRRRPLSLTDLQSAFIVFVLGCSLASFFFLLEKYQRKIRSD